MYQGRGLQRMVGPLTPHVGAGQSLQLVIDQRNQLLTGFVVPLRELREQSCDICLGGAHSNISRLPRRGKVAVILLLIYLPATMYSVGLQASGGPEAFSRRNDPPVE